jgi:pyruvate dehydrogenase E1 component alpha subunit
MFFNDYYPAEDKIFRIIDNEGKVINPGHMPSIDPASIRNAYHAMLFARTADQMAVSYQRQGRMFTYPPILGQEAIQVAAGMLIQRNDWLVPAFREMAVMLAKGVSLKELFLYYLGNEEGSNFQNAHHVLPICVPIGSQLLHATGIAYAIKYNKKDEVVFPFIGDGGTSEGDFSEALNFAAVWQVPVVFTIQNNQYAISVPVHQQTRSINLAVKSIAFGMPGIKVDGNDFFAMYKAYEEAASWARAGNGPVLIEAFTYRKGAHTTSDDPSKYRTREEEQSWEAKDPLLRLKKYMLEHSIDTEDEDALIASYKEEVDRQFIAAEQFRPYELEDVFKHMYVEMPDELKRQKEAYEDFLKWKETQR